MTKMRNSKRGFTLSEILIVTAIIVIVSAAAFTGVAITLSRARDTQKNLKENNGDNFEVAARSEVDAINENAADFAEIPTYKPKDSESSEESSDESSDNSESTNGGGNGAEPNTPTPKPTATPTPKPTATPLPSPTPKPAGGSTTVGNVTVTLVPKGEHQRGVVSVSGSGNKQTLVLQSSDGWCPDNAEFTITKNGSSYTLTVPEHDFRYQLDQNLFKDLYKTYTYNNLNNDQINYLKNTWGIQLG